MCGGYVSLVHVLNPIQYFALIAYYLFCERKQCIVLDWRSAFHNYFLVFIILSGIVVLDLQYVVRLHS